MYFYFERSYIFIGSFSSIFWGSSFKLINLFLTGIFFSDWFLNDNIWDACANKKKYWIFFTNTVYVFQTPSTVLEFCANVWCTVFITLFDYIKEYTTTRHSCTQYLFFYFFSWHILFDGSFKFTYILKYQFGRTLV